MSASLFFFIRFLQTAGLIVLANVSFAFLATEASSFEVHEFFEAQCGHCHQHAINVAQENLIIEHGTLRGRTSGNDIRTFLPAHFGHPNQEETSALYDLFFRQVKEGGVFKDRCTICHGSARELAHGKLIRDGDVVRGRYSGNNLTEFLSNHARIGADEVDFFIQLLARMAPTLDH